MSKENCGSSRQLLELWADQTGAKSITDQLFSAKITGKEVAFIAIGCPDWQDWSQGDQTTWHIGKINHSNKRARRFAQEVSEWQNSLLSLGINSVVNFTLSNIDINDPRVFNLGSIFDDQSLAAENLNHSLETLASLLQSSGAKIKPFDHWEIWRQLGNPESQFNSYEAFLAALFDFDLKVTVPLLVEPGQVGPIWLDIQSTQFKTVVAEFRRQATGILPVLSPFKNCGNWHARPEPKPHFPDIFELLQGFGFKPAADLEEWRQKTLKLPDPVILAALRAFGNESLLTINNWDERRQAIDWLMQIVFI